MLIDTYLQRLLMLPSSDFHLAIGQARAGVSPTPMPGPCPCAVLSS